MMRKTILILSLLALTGWVQMSVKAQDTLVRMKSNATEVDIQLQWTPTTAVVKVNGVTIPHNTRATILVNNDSTVFITTDDGAQLTRLYCENNQLTELDVSNNTALQLLYCYFNQLTELDVSNNTALRDLYCYVNQLTELDVSNNTALEWLSCYNNQLTELDVSNNTVLQELVCYFNQLTELDVSNNTALQLLHCYNNQLTELDVSNNTVLQELSCSYNQLTELDVSNNTALTYLYAQGQQIEVPILSGATTFSNPVFYKTPAGEQSVQIETVGYAYNAAVPITKDTMSFTTNLPAGIQYGNAFGGSITFVAGTSIAETETNTINLYPNPAQSTLYIMSAEEVEQVSVYDISGRTVGAYGIRPYSTSIDISNLANGIYLVKVKTAAGETVKKLTVNN
jgi:Leucine-rich repeat (LRR) protein